MELFFVIFLSVRKQNGSLREGAGTRSVTEGECATIKLSQISFCPQAPSTTSWSPSLSEGGFINFGLLFLFHKIPILFSLLLSSEKSDRAESIERRIEISAAQLRERSIFRRGKIRASLGQKETVILCTPQHDLVKKLSREKLCIIRARFTVAHTLGITHLLGAKHQKPHRQTLVWQERGKPIKLRKSVKSPSLFGRFLDR